MPRASCVITLDQGNTDRNDRVNTGPGGSKGTHSASTLRFAATERLVSGPEVRLVRVWRRIPSYSRTFLLIFLHVLQELVLLRHLVAKAHFNEEMKNVALIFLKPITMRGVCVTLEDGNGGFDPIKTHVSV